MWYALCLYYGLTLQAFVASNEIDAETGCRAVCLRLLGLAIYAGHLLYFFPHTSIYRPNLKATTMVLPTQLLLKLSRTMASLHIEILLAGHSPNNQLFTHYGKTVISELPNHPTHRHGISTVKSPHMIMASRATAGLTGFSEERLAGCAAKDGCWR